MHSARLIAIRRLLCAAALGACAACAGSGQTVVERLDERTGVTFRHERELLVFARTEARYSRSARDYLYLGAVETNRQGVREYFLWVGVGSTLDRGYLGVAGTVPAAVYVTLDGEPMELELEPWAERVPYAPQIRPYAPPVRLEAQLAGRVTRAQLELLARAPLAQVLARDANGATRSYVRWDNERHWSGFGTVETATANQRE